MGMVLRGSKPSDRGILPSRGMLPSEDRCIGVTIGFSICNCGLADAPSPALPRSGCPNFVQPGRSFRSIVDLSLTD
jgi:hypothetical protein